MLRLIRENPNDPNFIRRVAAQTGATSTRALRSSAPASASPYHMSGRRSSAAASPAYQESAPLDFGNWDRWVAALAAAGNAERDGPSSGRGGTRSERRASTTAARLPEPERGSVTASSVAAANGAGIAIGSRSRSGGGVAAAADAGVGLRIDGWSPHAAAAVGVTLANGKTLGLPMALQTSVGRRDSSGALTDDAGGAADQEGADKSAPQDGSSSIHDPAIALGRVAAATALASPLGARRRRDRALDPFAVQL